MMTAILASFARSACYPTLAQPRLLRRYNPLAHNQANQIAVGVD